MVPPPQTAQALELTIPQSLLIRADQPQSIGRSRSGWSRRVTI